MHGNQLSFFVYGTLLPGQPNYHLWGQAIRDEQPAALPGARLYDMGGFPLLVETGEERVRGRLITVEPSAYLEILAAVDALERFDPARPDNVYRRVRRWVAPHGPAPATPAWLYLGDRRLANGRPVIPGGDWLRYAAGRRAELAQWWADNGALLDNLFPFNQAAPSDG